MIIIIITTALCLSCPVFSKRHSLLLGRSVCWVISLGKTRKNQGQKKNSKLSQQGEVVEHRPMNAGVTV